MNNVNIHNLATNPQAIAVKAMVTLTSIVGLLTSVIQRADASVQRAISDARTKQVDWRACKATTVAALKVAVIVLAYLALRGVLGLAEIVREASSIALRKMELLEASQLTVGELHHDNL